MKRVGISVLIVLIIWFLIHSIIIIIDGIHDKLGKCDVGVVLGSKVEVTGKPSLGLRVRLDRGVELYRQGYFKHIIVSGGLGKEGYYEGHVMREYLIDKGVPAAAIITDDLGKNTMETAVNTRLIMEKQQFQSVMIITQYYHITRTKLAFRKSGIKSFYWAHGMMILQPRDIYATAREVIGYYAYLLK